MSDTKRDEINNEALAMAVIGHLGPSALDGGKMSVLDAFELGWQAALSQPEREALPQADKFLSEVELTALERFRETSSDGEGYDVDKSIMQRLACIGVIRHRSAGYYEFTDFGHYVLGELPWQQSNIPQPSAQSPGIDAVKVRDDALEGAASVCDRHSTNQQRNGAIELAEQSRQDAAAIRELKSQPLPSQPEPLGQALIESDMLDMAVEAGLWPNTIHHWMPALRRYTDALLQKAGASGMDAKDAERLDVLSELVESAYVGSCFELDEGGGIHLTIEAPSAEPVAYRNMENLRAAIDAHITSTNEKS